MRGTAPGLGGLVCGIRRCTGSWRGEGSHPGSFFLFLLRKRRCKRNPHLLEPPDKKMWPSVEV